MIAVVDYGRGNLFSIGQVLRHIGAQYEVTNNPKRLAAADRIIFPGVGAFADAMSGLAARGLVEPLKDAMRSGTPILGICLGCQLMLERGEEFGEHAGLGFFEGVVSRLPDFEPSRSNAVRIPNVGWRPLVVCREDPVLGKAQDGEMMYFVHSYAPMVKDENRVLATISINGNDVPVAIRCKSVLGVQFHPEKSGTAGISVIRRFLEADFGT